MSEDNALRIWSFRHREMIREIKWPFAPTTAKRSVLRHIDITSDGRLVACSAESYFGHRKGILEPLISTIYLYDTGKGDFVGKIGRIKGSITRLAFSRNGLLQGWKLSSC